MPAISNNMRGPIPRRDWAETPEQRSTRLAQERALIAEAEAELESGLYLELEEVAEWLAKLDSDEDLPLPQPKHRDPG